MTRRTFELECNHCYRKPHPDFQPAAKIGDLCLICRKGTFDVVEVDRPSMLVCRTNSLEVPCCSKPAPSDQGIGELCNRCHKGFIRYRDPLRDLAWLAEIRKTKAKLAELTFGTPMDYKYDGPIDDDRWDYDIDISNIDKI